MKRLRSAILLSLAALLGVDAYAVPIITATSGASIVTNQTLNVSGTGLPAKSRTKLFLYADGQSGSIAAHSGLSFVTGLVNENMTNVSDSNTRWGAGVFRSNVNYTSTQRAATLRPTSTLPVTYGTRILISWWEKSNITYLPQNWKGGVRWWVGSAGSPNYPSHYIFSLAGGSSSTGDIRKNIEFPTSSTGLGGGYGFPNSTWRRITVLYEMNSSIGSTDGKMYIYKNNTLVRTDTNLRFNESSSSPSGRTVGAFANMPYFQHVIANANWAAGSFWWLSDMVLDDSWGRYEIGNASTYAACTQLELQPYTSASATNATLTIRTGTITGSKWLYACDNDNNCNAVGFPLSAGGLAAPSINNISPQNGPSTGGTTVTLNGADLVSTPQITVGGLDATGETYISPTQMTFVTPAGVAGSSAQIVLINPDSQSDSFTGFNYDPEEATIDPVAEAFPWISN